MPKEAPPEVEPSADAPTPAPPFTLDAPPAGAVCTYRVQDHLTDSMGGDVLAASETEIDYVLRSMRADSALVLEAQVERVAARGRREDTKFDLDSDRPGDVRRVSGGADATIEPEMVAWFALVGVPIRIHLDERGHVLRVEGGDAARTRFLSYHAPVPRKSKHYSQKAQVRLADGDLVARFLPYAGLVYEEGDLTEGREATDEIERVHPDFTVKVMQGRRVRTKGKRIFWDELLTFAPSEKPHSVPPLEHGPKQKYLRGNGRTTVALQAKSPCFLQAARSVRHELVWSGTIRGADVDVERHHTLTRQWRKGS